MYDVGIDANLHIWGITDTSLDNGTSDAVKKSGGGKKKGSAPRVEFKARIDKLWSVSHESKINALITDNLTIRQQQSTTSSSTDESSSQSTIGVSGRVFVADMSTAISVYDIQ